MHTGAGYPPLGGQKGFWPYFFFTKLSDSKVAKVTLVERFINDSDMTTSERVSDYIVLLLHSS